LIQEAVEAVIAEAVEDSVVAVAAEEWTAEVVEAVEHQEVEAVIVEAVEDSVVAVVAAAEEASEPVLKSLLNPMIDSQVFIL